MLPHCGNAEPGPRKLRSILRWLGLVLQLAMFLHFFPALAAAGEDAEKPKSPDPEAVAQLTREVEALRARLTELETTLNAVRASAVPAEDLPEAVHAAPPPDRPADPPPAAPSATPVPSSPRSVPMPLPQDNSGASPPVGVKLRMFGDLGYEVSDQKGETNSYHIGSLDLFLTGALSSRVSILGEVLFTPQPDNSFGIDVERLLLQYKHNDYFTIGIGRFHTSIGYYNTAFHQGAWFQTAIDRPFMYAFDDQGGFLPLQEVGVTASGNIPSGGLGLHYVVESGNGRSHILDSDPAQNTQDTNNGKSINFSLSARPSRVNGLQVGFSIYHDYLTFSDNINHSELISTVWVVFNNSTYEFLNEGMVVRHALTSAGTPGVFHTPGFYTLFSRRFGKFRPYFRYSYINAGVDEPIYGDPTDGPPVGRRNGPSAGVRWDFNGHAAAKLQYDHLSERGLKSVNNLETQVSFAF